MGYGYAETFLIIFLTHPGVIIPNSTSVMSAVSEFVPPEYASAIPDIKIPPTISALWQILWAWILSLPGEKSAAFGWTMYALYIFFLLLYMYLFAYLRFRLGV